MVHVGKGEKKIIILYIVNYRNINNQIKCNLINYFISYYRHSIHHHQYKPGYKTYQKVGVLYSPLSLLQKSLNIHSSFVNHKLLNKHVYILYYLAVTGGAVTRD